MKDKIFYRFKNHYLFLNNDYNNNKLLIDKEIILSQFKHLSNYRGKQINSVIDELCEPQKRYLFIHKDEKGYIAFVELKTLLYVWYLIREKRTLNYLHSIAISAVNQFKHTQKETLLQKMTNKNSSFNEDLCAITEYAFCEHYSIWSYCKITDYVICEASSFDNDSDYLNNDEDCGFHSMIKNNEFYQFKQVDSQFKKASILHDIGIKSINRILVDLDDGKNTKFIINLYSKTDNFELNEHVRQRVVSLIIEKFKMKLQIINDEKMEKIIHQITPQLDIDMDTYLNLFCKILCSELKFEACSIFIRDDDTLRLSGTCDVNKNEVVKDIRYPLDKTYKEYNTSIVAKENKILFSYNLKNEKNSHLYDEDVELDSSNWIGIPVNIGGMVNGVMRVKNKYIISNNIKIIKPPKPISFIQIKELSVTLAVIIDIYQKYEIEKKRMSDNDDFMTVLLHEIKTPLNTFNTFPDTIKKKLKRDVITDEIKKKTFNLLDDIKKTGLRLTYLVGLHNVDEILKSAVISKISVLQKIIYPVTNISKDYIMEKYDIYLAVDHNSIRNHRVYGDERLLTLALNALVDNAAKYSLKESKSIHIHCKKENKKLLLLVKSKSFKIDDDEKELIFEKRKRGKHTPRNKPGTGIGLYLAKNIMQKMEGDLLLQTDPKINENTFIMKMNLCED